MLIHTDIVRISGTIGNYTYYVMEGKYYVRRKSSLTRERVLTDPAFEPTRKAGALHGRAAKIASPLYRQLQEQKRKQTGFGNLTAFVKRLLIEGKTEEEIVVAFMNQYAGLIGPAHR